MKRSAPLKPSKILPRRELQRSAPLVAKSPMKKSARPKMTAARRSAKGQSCTLRFPGCGTLGTETVLCHIRQLGGGGVGMKPADNESAYGCPHCHDVLDGRIPWVKDAPEGFDFWERIAKAMAETQRRMRAAGVLTMKGDSE